MGGKRKRKKQGSQGGEKKGQFPIRNIDNKGEFNTPQESEARILGTDEKRKNRRAGKKDRGGLFESVKMRATGISGDSKQKLEKIEDEVLKTLVNQQRKRKKKTEYEKRYWKGKIVGKSKAV